MRNERMELNRNLAQMLKGGVIMDVTTPEQARIAEAAGACAVMALLLLIEPLLRRRLHRWQGTACLVVYFAYLAAVSFVPRAGA